MKTTTFLVAFLCYIFASFSVGNQANQYLNVGSWRTSDVTLTNLHDNGNHFNETSGQFTAPVNGLYFFSTQIRFDAINEGHFRLLFSLNGTTSLDNGLHAIAEGDTGTNFYTLSYLGL